MKKLFFALLFVFTFAHATDFSLEKDECIILVASTKSSSEAEELRKKYPGSELYTSKSGYIAVGLEKISKQGSSARIKELLSAGKIPKGSNCADNTRITGLLADGEATAQNTSKDALPEVARKIFNKKWSLSDLPCNLNGGTYTIYTNQPPSGETTYLAGKINRSEQRQDFEFRISDTEKNVLFRIHTIFADGNKFVMQQVGNPNTVVTEIVEKITLQNNNKIIINRELRQLYFDQILAGKIAYAKKNENTYKNLCK
jgi:hypothetical protein